jgi:hypothetical protein
MFVPFNDNIQNILDTHFALKCPHCGVLSNLTAVSVPIYAQLSRFRPEKIGIGYRCDSCNEAVFLRFSVDFWPEQNQFEIIEDGYEEVERSAETFEFKYLPALVASDFQEALICYSAGALNGFGAMCRRTVQSACADLGAAGTDKVLNQLRDLKNMGQIDDETFDVLKQVVLDGHDATHPHLPKLNSDRAAVLLVLMKDVLYLLYVRREKINEAASLRKDAIKQNK